METKANTALIGAFTLIVLALGFVFIYWLARGGEQTSNVPLNVVFNDPVTGLGVGSQVLLNGIKIGDVKALSLDPERPQVVVAELSVQPLRSIKQDTQVTLGFQGLTGVGYVEMAGGDPNLPPIWESMPDPTITAARSSMQDLLAGARDILARTDETLQSIEQLVSENTDDITQSVRDVQTFTGALAENADDVANLVDQVSRASAGIADATSRLQGIVTRGEALMTAVDPEQVNAAIDNIFRTTESIAAESERIGSIVQRADAIAADIQGFSQHLPALGERTGTLVAAIDPERLAGTLERIDTIAMAIEPDQVRSAVAGASSLGAAIAANQEGIEAAIANAATASTALATFAARLPSIGDKTDTLLAAIDPAQVGQAIDRINGIAAAIEPERVRVAVDGVSSFGETLAANRENIDNLVTRLTLISTDLAAFTPRLPAIGEKADALFAAIDPAAVGLAVDRIGTVAASIDPERVQVAVNGVASFGETLADNSQAIENIVTHLSLISTDLAAFTPRLPAIGERTETLLAALDGEKIGDTVDSLQQFAATLRDNSDDIDAIIGDARGVSSRFEALSARAESLMVQLESMAGEGTGGILEEAQLTLAAIQGAADNFNAQVSTLGAGFGDFSDRGLRDFQNLISEGQRTISRLDSVISNLEQNPSSLIFGGPGVPEYSGQRR